MKKLLILILGLVIWSHIMAFSLSTLDFNEKVKLNKRVSKEFIIKNDRTKPMRYQFFIEDGKNVKVSPETVILKPFERKSFKVEATGRELGSHQYLLVIKESRIEKEKGLNIDMSYEIEQKYEVIK